MHDRDEHDRHRVREVEAACRLVQELAHTRLAGQVAYHPGKERPVGPHAENQVRIGLDRCVPGFPVGLVVVLATQPVVVHPRYVGHAGVKGRVLGFAGGEAVGSLACRWYPFARHGCAFLTGSATFTSGLPAGLGYVSRMISLRKRAVPADVSASATEAVAYGRPAAFSSALAPQPSPEG